MQLQSGQGDLVDMADDVAAMVKALLGGMPDFNLSTNNGSYGGEARLPVNSNLNLFASGQFTPYQSPMNLQDTDKQFKAGLRWQW